MILTFSQINHHFRFIQFRINFQIHSVSLERMLLEIVFFIYLTIMILAILYLGTNLIRIRDKFKTHPKIICFMLPFLINFIAAKTVFYNVSPFLSTLLPAIIFFLFAKRLENVRIFGLTGGIATGKSTMIRVLRNNLIIQIIDCDEISRKLSGKDKSGYKLIVKMLGDKAQEYLNPRNKELNREKFSNFVFQNPQFRKKLTKQMGKLIMWEIFKQIISNILAKKYVMIIDAPILYETKVLEHVCYPVIVVGCSQETQIKRLKTRNGYSPEQAISRIKSQMPLEEKKKKCQMYLENDGTQNQLLSAFLKKIMRYLDKRQAMSFKNAPL